MAQREPALLGPDDRVAADASDVDTTRTVAEPGAGDDVGDDVGDDDGDVAERSAPVATPLAPALQVSAPRAVRREAPTVLVVGFWRRLVAGLIDGAVILPAAMIVVWIASRLTGVRLPRGLDFWLDLILASDPALVMAVGLSIAVAAVYALVFQVAQARTLGMRVMGMRIIDVYGDPPSAARCLVRTVGYLGGVFTLLLGFIWIGFDREKRGLQDWIAGTYVIRG